MQGLKAMLLVGGLLAPVTLVAQEPAAGPPAGAPQRMRMQDPGPGPGGAMFAPGMLLERRSRLALTEDQVTRLEALAAAVRQADDKAAADVKPHEEKLREMWNADQPDSKAIQAEMRALMEARQTAHLTALGAAAEAKGLLTAEQRGRVQGWVEGRRMQMRRQFDRGPGWGDGPRHGYRAYPRMRRY